MTDELRWYLLSQRRFETRIVEIFKIFRQNKIEPILFKGWAAARWYPTDTPRFYSDIDLSVAAADYEKALSIAESKEASHFGIDLHREFRHLDRRPWQEVFEACDLVNLRGTEVRVPSAEDHLRIMSAHWLTDGGAYRERLKDIFYAVENRPEGFDWNSCLSSGGPIRRNWTETAIGLSQKYLGPGSNPVPPKYAPPAPPEWVCETVEREWSSDVRLKPLQTCLGDRREFFRQLRKRFPPNPIQTSVELDRAFGKKPPSKGAALWAIARRTGPSVKRMIEVSRRGK
jgi:hypothetical protein